MTDKVTLKEDLKKILRAILISAGGYGLSVSRVLHDFKETEGRPLPFRTLGYFSPEDFFRDIPDVIFIQYNRFGEMMLRGISDENTYHIERMIQNQKNPRGGSFVKSNGRKSSQARRVYHVQEPPKPIVDAMMRGKIKDLLYAYPTGLLASDFSVAFSRMFGHDLHLKGFRSLVDMLSSLPDILRFEEMPNGGLRLHAKTLQRPQRRQRQATGDISLMFIFYLCIYL